jgi:hypothetical protein
MMDIILRGVIIFVVVFLLMMGVYAFAMLRNRKKIGIFQANIKEHFPHITAILPYWWRNKKQNRSFGYRVATR